MGYEKQRQRLRLGGIAAANSANFFQPSVHPPHQPTQHMRSPRDVVCRGCGKVQADAVRKALVGGKQLTGHEAHARFAQDAKTQRNEDLHETPNQLSILLFSLRLRVFALQLRAMAKTIFQRIIDREIPAIAPPKAMHSRRMRLTL